MRHSIAVAAAAALCLGSAVLGHGSMADPPSRVYKIFLDGPMTPQSDAARAAIAVSGTQAFYDWHEVSRNIPGYDYRAAIPDGQLAGAGREKYAGLNLARTDWFATPVTAGPRVCRFFAATPHDPSFFRAFITRAGYDPRQPLKWDDLVEIAGGETAELRGSCGKGSGDCHCGTSGAGLSYFMTLQIPERIGRHVLFVAWQRVDPAAEVFFSASDLDFGGVDYGDDNDGPDLREAPLTASFAWTNQWAGGGQASITLTNGTPYEVRGWRLGFDWSADVNSLWGGSFTRDGTRYSVVNVGWNETIAPGASVEVGCVATMSVPGLLPTSLVAWGTVPGGLPPCAGDGNGDRSVDAADLGMLLAAWGRTSEFDMNADGTTDGLDLAVLLAAWGACK
jgi:chitin-binding protein